MQRNFEEINKAIHDVNFQCTEAFKKCKESAPIGYKFSTNIKADDLENINEYLKQKCIVSLVAYDMFGDVIPNYVAVYEKYSVVS